MGRLARRFNWLIACFVCASSLTVVSAQSPSPQFEVASIKRNVTGEEMMTFRTLPDGTVQMSNITVQLAISRAYPELYAIANVPAWATSERYDIVAKGPAGASATTAPAMLRTLFADRLKLRAHVEQREEPAYNLVIANANGRLGPDLNPSRLDCANVEPRAPNAPIPTIPTPEEAKARCGGIILKGVLLSGGMTMSSLAGMLRGPSGRPVQDRTNLPGYFAVVLQFATVTQQLAGQAERPSLFTALVEQLGLKLEPASMPVQILVVDTLERPSEN